MHLHDGKDFTWRDLAIIVATFTIGFAMIAAAGIYFASAIYP